MKALVTRKVEVEVKTVKIDIPLRETGKGQRWVALVDIDTGKIQDWLDSNARELYEKVRDEGVYTLFDSDGNEVVQLAGYVPHGVVPGECGDYIGLEIDEEGVITNWPESPYLDDFFQNDD